VARVHSAEQVQLVRQELLSDGKVARATHNIVAYRIEFAPGRFLQDCDDDGEHGARLMWATALAEGGGVGRIKDTDMWSSSARVLHLLQITNSVNVIVVVSRWWGPPHQSLTQHTRAHAYWAVVAVHRYGGIQLGPDRFKHINNAAR
jgi:putative IMPACT (imprinted ancient) family translation regulator